MIATAAALVSPLLLLLLSSSASAERWDVDCGASKGFVSNLTGLTWVGDGEFVRGGESRVVENATGLAWIYVNLRAFPKNKKNCYTFPDVSADTKVMVRAGFRYGNYDGRASPPSFQLQYDGQDVIRVDTTLNTTEWRTMVYVTARKGTSVCLGRLSEDQDPFVSMIQLATLDPGMYAGLNASFVLLPLGSLWGYALGAPELFRAPDDKYDRWWGAIDGVLGLGLSDYDVVNASSTIKAINTSTAADKPPAKLFETGIAATAASGNLSMRTSFLDNGSYPFYFNMYFSEIESIAATDKRTFNIYRDNQAIATSVTPPVGEALEITYITPNATASTTFTLAPTANSTLPPLINGVEIAFVLSFSRALTNIGDVEALSLLQGNLTTLQNWTGDPCLPAKYHWEWVECNSEQSPRVVKLFLGGYGLSGTLPDFSGLDALRTIELQRNNLQGEIPDFLANFPHLQVLNLADNNFSSIPSSLINSPTTVVNVTGNPQFCKEGATCIYGPFNSKEAPPPSKQSNTAVASSFSLCLLLLSAIVVVIHM